MSKVDNVTHIMSQVLDRYRNSIPRKAFIDAMDAAMRAGTYINVDIEAPYTLLSKADIVCRGAALGIDYATTYSCYKGGKRHCGTCGTCRERQEAFALAHIEDPTEYEAN